MDIDIEKIVKSATSNLDLSQFKGDVVALKYVENEIGNVEPGGIGVQIVNGKQTNSASSPSDGKTVSPKQSPHFYDTPPLIYKYKGESFNETKRLTILFQYLCKEYEPTKTWIDPATNPDDFLSLFTGTNSSAVIVWTAPKQRLFGLFKRMKERKIITTPKGYGLWQIVQNHFSDWHGNMFQDFNKEHMPQEPVYSAIEAFVDILDPACTTNADLDEYAKNIGKTFGKR